MLRGAKRRGNPYLFRQKSAKNAEFMRFRNGLPRQSADWLAMTGFFDRLKPPKGWFFFIFRALRSKIDEAQTRFPASHEWQSHSQEPCLHLWIRRASCRLRQRVPPCPRHSKKKDTRRGVFLFGAGYGSRTRLNGLGSRCNTDIPTLHSLHRAIVAHL